MLSLLVRIKQDRSFSPFLGNNFKLILQKNTTARNDKGVAHGASSSTSRRQMHRIKCGSYTSHTLQPIISPSNNKMATSPVLSPTDVAVYHPVFIEGPQGETVANPDHSRFGFREKQKAVSFRTCLLRCSSKQNVLISSFSTSEN